MNVEQVIQKVRQLRALSERTTVHEAAAAAATADKLMQQYRIEEAALELADGTHAEMAKGDELLGRWGRKPTWIRALLKGVCDHYGVAFHYSVVRKKKGGSSTAYAWGRRDDIALAREMFAFLQLEIDTLARALKGRGRSAIDSFRRGAVCGVVGELERAKREAMASAPPGTAIVLASRLDESMLAMRQGLPRAVDVTMPNRVSDGDAFREGIVAGQNIDLAAGKRLGGGEGR